MTREKVEFTSDGLKLKGHVYTPERGKPPLRVVGEACVGFAREHLCA